MWSGVAVAEKNRFDVFQIMSKFVSPFGYTHPQDDKRQMCPYCYNEDTQRIVDFLELEPYRDYHRGKPYKAYSCYCCGGWWHWSESV